MYLHSNMVRFIIGSSINYKCYSWHNLHSNMVRFIIHMAGVEQNPAIDLHSNMVRFIIYLIILLLVRLYLFTFQYG